MNEHRVIWTDSVRPNRVLLVDSIAVAPRIRPNWTDLDTVHGNITWDTLSAVPGSIPEWIREEKQPIRIDSAVVLIILTVVVLAVWRIRDAKNR